MSGTASAPGKLMLLGEYAVLEGGIALAAAVNRRASGRWVEHPVPRSGVVQAVLEAARRSGLAHEGEIEIDTSAFRDAKGRKLGLGSSAAAAVIASALAVGTGDETALRVAIEGHRAAAGGEGSGVDVAASYYGGVIASRRQPAPVAALASKIRNLTVTALFTHESADTAELVRACRASANWGQWSRALCALSDEGVRAYETQQAERFLSVVARYGRAMDAMGKDAGAPIVTEAIDAVMRIAEEERCAAKPSGAGGGDVAIVWSADPDAAHRIAERTGTELIDVAIDPRGLRRA
jgi:phosphomevalonate kinase